MENTSDCTLQVLEFPSRVYLEHLGRGDIVAHEVELTLHDERILLCLSLLDFEINFSEDIAKQQAYIPRHGVFGI